MAIYTYQIDVFTVRDGQRILIGDLSGTVESDRYSSACIKAWPLINAGCKELVADTGLQIGVGDLVVERVTGE